jgi:hypothetical protein
MALVTIGGIDVVSARIWMPRIGVWNADIVVDEPTIPPAPQRLTMTADGGLALTGTTMRAGAWLETSYARFVGGNDGMRRTAVPKFYAAANVGLVLGDLLATAGEKLSPTAQPAVLGARVAGWTTIAQPIGQALAVLVARGAPAGTAWRVLPDGTVWIGAETWPDCGLTEPGDYVEMQDWPEDNRIELGVETLKLLPGTTIGGRRVSFVEHVLKDGYVRSKAMLE